MEVRPGAGFEVVSCHVEENIMDSAWAPARQV